MDKDNKLYWSTDNRSKLSTTERQKKAYFIGVKNSKDNTIPYTATMADKNKYMRDGYFGFHIIDKAMTINITTLPGVFDMPKYDPYKIKNGKDTTDWEGWSQCVICDNTTCDDTTECTNKCPNVMHRKVNSFGSMKCDILNGLPDRYETTDQENVIYTYFVEQTFGSTHLKINTPSYNANNPSFEDKMPVERFVNGLEFTDETRDYIKELIRGLGYVDEDVIKLFDLVKDDQALRKWGLSIGGDNNCIPLLEDGTLHIEDRNGCIQDIEINGFAQLVLGEDSINDCVDRSRSRLSVQLEGNSETVKYYAFNGAQYQYQNNTNEVILTPDHGKNFYSEFPLNDATPSGDGFPFSQMTVSNNNILLEEESSLASKVSTLIRGDDGDTNDSGETVYKNGLSTSGNFVLYGTRPRVKELAIASYGNRLVVDRVGYSLYNQGIFYIIAIDENNNRTLSPVYDFSYLLYVLCLGTTDFFYTIETKNSAGQTQRELKKKDNAQAIGLNIEQPTKPNRIKNVCHIPFYFSFYRYEMNFNFTDGELNMLNDCKFIYNNGYRGDDDIAAIIAPTVIDVVSAGKRIVFPTNTFTVKQFDETSTSERKITTQCVVLNGDSVEPDWTISVSDSRITAGITSDEDGKFNIVITITRPQSGTLPNEIVLKINATKVGSEDLSTEITISLSNEGEENTTINFPEDRDITDNGTTELIDTLKEKEKDGQNVYARDVSGLRHHLVRNGTIREKYTWITLSFDPNGGEWIEDNGFTDASYDGTGNVYNKLYIQKAKTGNPSTANVTREQMMESGSNESPKVKREGYVFGGWYMYTEPSPDMSIQYDTVDEHLYCNTQRGKNRADSQWTNITHSGYLVAIWNAVVTIHYVLYTVDNTRGIEWKHTNGDYILPSADGRTITVKRAVWQTGLQTQPYAGSIGYTAQTDGTVKREEHTTINITNGSYDTGPDHTETGTSLLHIMQNRNHRDDEIYCNPAEVLYEEEPTNNSWTVKSNYAIDSDKKVDIAWYCISVPTDEQVEYDKKIVPKTANMCGIGRWNNGKSEYFLTGITRRPNSQGEDKEEKIFPSMYPLAMCCDKSEKCNDWYDGVTFVPITTTGNKCGIAPTTTTIAKKLTEYAYYDIFTNGQKEITITFYFTENKTKDDGQTDNLPQE